MFYDQSERAPGPIYIIKAVKRTRIFYEYTRVVKDKSNIIFQTFQEFRQKFSTNLAEQEGSSFEARSKVAMSLSCSQWK